MNSSNQVMASSASTNRFTFSGREFLWQIGLYDFRNRHYSSDLGRFVESDPMGFAAEDVNLYRYCSNDPIELTDSTGLDTFLENRELAVFSPSGTALAPYQFISHTFVFTNPDCGDLQTYRGNSANTQGWNKDQPEDVNAAHKGLQNGDADRVDDATLDPCVDEAYNYLAANEPKHSNGIVTNNCKTEAQILLNLARSIRDD